MADLENMIEEVEQEEDIEKLKKKVIDNLIATERLRVDEKKIDEETKRHDQEIVMRNKELKQKYVLSLIDITVKTGVTVSGVILILTFEEKGTLTSKWANTVLNWIAGKK